MTQGTGAAKEMLLRCINASLEKKARNVVVLNVQALSSFTDYFILLSGTSSRQVQAISAAIRENLRQQRILPLGVEGEAGGQWVLLDYGDVVIHVFYEPIREFYDLERLWSEAPRMDIPGETTRVTALAEGL